MNSQEKTFSLEELCALVGMNRRKIRFYIQKGLVERPEGSGRGASYNHRHLEQLLTIRKWKDAGLSLERIQELLAEETQEGDPEHPKPPPRRQKAGSLEVWSRLFIADGIELHIEPGRSGLTPEQVRALCRAVITQYQIVCRSSQEGHNV